MYAKNSFFMPFFLCFTLVFRLCFLSFGPENHHTTSLYRNYSFKNISLKRGDKKTQYSVRDSAPDIYAVSKLKKSKKGILNKKVKLALQCFIVSKIIYNAVPLSNTKIDLPDFAVASSLSSQKYISLSTLRI